MKLSELDGMIGQLVRVYPPDKIQPGYGKLLRLRSAPRRWNALVQIKNAQGEFEESEYNIRHVLCPLPQIPSILFDEFKVKDPIQDKGIAFLEGRVEEICVQRYGHTDVGIIGLGKDGQWHDSDVGLPIQCAHQLFRQGYNSLTARISRTGHWTYFSDSYCCYYNALGRYFEDEHKRTGI